MLLGNPVIGTVNTPPAVLPEAVALPRGDGDVPHVTPSAVSVPPFEVTFPPRVAVVAVIDADVGVVTTGSVAVVVNVPSDV